MGLHRVEIAAIEYAKQVHAYYRHEMDPWLLAQKMGLRVVRGEHDALCGHTITLSPTTASNRRRSAEVIRHEIAHHILHLGGIEGQVFRYRNTFEAGLPTLENLCFHTALVLLIPDPAYCAAIQQHGHLPAAIVKMCVDTGAGLPDALRRWVYAEVGAKRAAFVTKRNLVVDAAKANMWIPFWINDEVHDVNDDLPDAQLLHLPRTYGPDRTLGVLVV